MTPQAYIKKCLELSEMAKKSTKPDDAFEFIAVGVDALPKVCEALKIAMEALDNRMHEDWCQVCRGFGDCD